jgi:hypothetical protein
MIRLICWLVAYDEWFAGRVETLLKWLEEWLSISQKYAERGMIALYLALMELQPSVKGTIWLRAGGAILMSYVLWWMHRRPLTNRGTTKRYPFAAVSRVLIQAFLLLVAADFFAFYFFALPHRPSVIGTGTAQIVYLVFIYMTDIASNGDRGRRRKLAWAELKKLFGTEWIPKPLPVPQ